MLRHTFYAQNLSFRLQSFLELKPDTELLSTTSPDDVLLQKIEAKTKKSKVPKLFLYRNWLICDVTRNGGVTSQEITSASISPFDFFEFIYLSKLFGSLNILRITPIPHNFAVS